jgi:hypothetical protein
MRENDSFYIALRGSSPSRHAYSLSSVKKSGGVSRDDIWQEASILLVNNAIITTHW